MLHNNYLRNVTETFPSLPIDSMHIQNCRSYRKNIPIISDGLILFHKPFLGGLFSGGKLIIGILRYMKYQKFPRNIPKIHFQTLNIAHSNYEE